MTVIRVQRRSVLRKIAGAGRRRSQEMSDIMELAAFAADCKQPPPRANVMWNT